MHYYIKHTEKTALSREDLRFQNLYKLTNILSRMKTDCRVLIKQTPNDLYCLRACRRQLQKPKESTTKLC